MNHPSPNSSPSPSPSPGPTFQRPPLRILLVEDSYLVARSLAKLLGDMGLEVIGPAGTVTSALKLLADLDVDAAILDVNLGGETVEPVAHALLELKRPLIFITGYSSPALQDPALLTLPRLSKPVNEAVLRATLDKALAPPPPPSTQP